MIRSLTLVKLLFVLLLVSVPLSARAQGELTVNVVAGFDGFYRAGKWCPVIVSVSNQPKNGQPGDRSLDFRGSIEVESRPEDEDAPPMLYRRDILVPAFSTQRFFLYAKFPETAPPIKPAMTLRNEDGKKLNDYPLDLNVVGNDKILVLTVGDSLGTLAVPILRGDLDITTRAKIPYRSLPDSWMGFDAVDVLIVSQWDESALNSAVRLALQDWVTLGGTLAFLGGVNTASYGDGEDNTLLPVTVQESERVVVEPSGISFRAKERDAASSSTPSDDAFVASRFTAKAGTEVVARATGGEPLFARRVLGAGQILYLAFDLDSTSGALSDALSPYWWALMPMPNLAGYQYSYLTVLRRGRSGGDDEGTTTDGLTILTESAGRPPNHFFIGLICLVYAGVVGPLNFYLLSRMKRFDLAWGTIPAIVIVFSILIFGLGKLTRGGTSIVRQVSLIQMAAGQSVGNLRSTAAAFTNAAGDFSFEPGIERAAVADDVRWNAYEGIRYFSNYIANPLAGQGIGFAERRPVIRTGADSIAVEQWPMRPFEVVQVQTRAPLELQGTIDVQAAMYSSGARLRGSVTNNSGSDFEESFIVQGGRTVSLGKITNGQTIDFGTDGKRGSRVNEWVPIREEIMRLVSDGRKETSPEINKHNAGVALGAYFYPPVSSLRIFPVEQGSCYFLGVTQEQKQNFQDTLDAGDVTHVTAALVKVPMTMGSPNLAVSREDLSISLHSVPENQTWFDMEDNGTIRMQKTRFIALFEVPIKGADVFADSVALDVTGTPGGGEKLTYSIYNFAQKRWDDVANNAPLVNSAVVGTGKNRGNCYVLPHHGRVFVQVKSERDPAANNQMTLSANSEIAEVGLRVALRRVTGEN
jgi:hypothetical protein